MKNIFATGLAALVLASCSPKQDQGETNPITNTTQNTIDSLKRVISKIDQEIQVQQGELNKQDSIIAAMTSYPDKVTQILKEPDIPFISKKDYMINGQILEKDELIHKLQSIIKNNKTKLVLEGCQEHQLYADSLILSSTFVTQTRNNIESQYNNLVKKGILGDTDSGLDSQKKQELHDWFVSYVRGKIKGERNSQVRNGIIHTEKLGGVTIYYTDQNKEYPGMIAHHSKIKPTSHGYIYSSGTKEEMYNSADYYGSGYSKPSHPITTISPRILKQYGITGKKETQRFLQIINSQAKVSTKQREQTITKVTQNTHTQPTIAQEAKDSITIEQAKEYFAQTYTIPTNGSHELIIRDFDVFDYDQIKVNQSDFPNGIIIDKTPTILDIRKLNNGELIVEIMYEGHRSPCTFAFKIGNHQQQINGKKGDKILLKFD